MAELIVVGFKKDMYRASEVLNTLQDMNDNWMVDLNDAVAVYRDYNGKLRVDQSYQMTTGEGAAWGGLLGGLSGPSWRFRSRAAQAQRRPSRPGRSAAARSVRQPAPSMRIRGRKTSASPTIRQQRRHDDPARRLGDLRAPAHPRSQSWPTSSAATAARFSARR